MKRLSRLGILAISLLLAACATANSKWQGAALASIAIDLGSTGAALEKNGLHEGNPLYGDQPSTEEVLAVNLAAYGSVWALTRHLEVVQQQRIWRNVAILRFAVTAWNIRQSGCVCFRLSF